MKLIIHITRYIDSIAEGEEIFRQVSEHFAPDPYIHINAIADHNFKHPEGPDANQDSRPAARLEENNDPETN